MKALDIAKYFLYLAREDDSGDTISNLKMQKMLYYAQGECLALLDKPLFEENIKAWEHGAVVPQVYNAFKRYGRNSISFDELDDFNTDFIKDEKIYELLLYVYDKYMCFSASSLRNKNHKEPTWQNTYKKGLSNTIKNEDIKSYFKLERQKETKRLKAIADEYARTLKWE